MAKKSELSDSIYERLRQDIVLGVLRPNQRVVEADVAEALDASRTPVRESLHRLGQEGLVRRDRSGWIVHEHTLEEVREIYEIRLALEGYGARLAAERGEAAEIKAIAKQVAQAVSAHELLTGERNTEFHEAVVHASKNARLVDMVRKTREYAFNERLARVYTPDELRRSGEDHKDLVKALLAHDGEKAEEIARRHVRNALGIIERLF